jgi:hypothetical protein
MSIMSGPPLYRYIPGVGRVSAGILGPTGPQGVSGTATNTGATGPTGPIELTPSGFSTMNSGTFALQTGYTGIKSTSVTTSATGYVLGQASVQVANPDSANHWVDFYITVNGSVGNTTSEQIEKKTGNVNGYGNFTLLHRSGLVGPGTWGATVYGRVRDVSNSASVVVDHLDLVALGNLQ